MHLPSLPIHRTTLVSHELVWYIVILVENMYLHSYLVTIAPPSEALCNASYQRNSFGQIEFRTCVCVRHCRKKILEKLLLMHHKDLPDLRPHVLEGLPASTTRGVARLNSLYHCGVTLAQRFAGSAIYIITYPCPFSKRPQPHHAGQQMSFWRLIWQTQFIPI